LVLIAVFALGRGTSLNGQAQLCSYTHQMLHGIRAEKGSESCAPFLRKVAGEPMLSFLAKGEPGSAEAIRNLGGICGKEVAGVFSLRIKPELLKPVCALDGLTSLAFAPDVRPMLARERADVAADTVHAGIGLPRGFSGKDVMIGITDWGFDYTHPTFYDTSLSRLRIHAAWDQYKQSGPAPAAFGYGTEYADSAALVQAGTDTSNIYEVHYHGTHVAGIAGGSGPTAALRGMAYDADLLFVTFLIDAAAVLDGLVWMKDKADAAGKRLVVNMSWGLYHFGAPDGTSLMSQAIDQLSSEGVIFVTSAGNNGDVSFHIRKNFTQDTLRSRVAFYPFSANPNMYGQGLMMWGEPNGAFSARIRVLGSGGVELAALPFHHTADSSFYEEGELVIASDTIRYTLLVESAYAGNLRPHIWLRIRNPFTAYAVDLEATAVAGEVHFWNVTDLTTGVGNWGMPFQSVGAGYTAGDSQYGIGEPAVAASAIGVAAYSARVEVSPNVMGGGFLASFSSSGPLVGEAQKPDIAAPGVNVLSAVNSFTNAAYTQVQTYSFQGKSYPYARASGTSMSGPVVAGIVALMLEANPGLTAAEVQNILIQTARQDQNTGVLPAGGHPRWGHGKVYALAAVWEALNLLSLESEQKSGIQLYPNPSRGVLQLSGIEKSFDYRVLDMQGREVQRGHYTVGESIRLNGIPSGIYILAGTLDSDFKPQRFLLISEAE